MDSRNTLHNNRKQANRNTYIHSGSSQTNSTAETKQQRTSGDYLHGRAFPPLERDFQSTVATVQTRFRPIHSLSYTLLSPTDNPELRNPHSSSLLPPSTLYKREKKKNINEVKSKPGWTHLKTTGQARTTNASIIREAVFSIKPKM